MNPESSVVDAAPFAARAVGTQVWDRVWSQHRSAQKDDALLARELRSPRFKAIVSRLESTFGSIRGLKTIELGCGRGDLSALMARRGAEVTLFDHSEAGLDEAKWRFDRLGLQAQYGTGDILGSLDAWNGRYDVVLSSGVIEHFAGEERTETVRAHCKVLKPGGLAVISVPNARCLPYRAWKCYLELRGWWPYGMEVPYTRRELLRRCRRVGFARIETQCHGFWQSVGDHWYRRLMGHGPDWVARPSLLDAWMGFVLLLFAWRADIEPVAAPGKD